MNHGRKKPEEQPVPNGMTRVVCPCGWSRLMAESENATEAARYHAIQVHNDVKATRKGVY